MSEILGAAGRFWRQLVAAVIGVAMIVLVLTTVGGGPTEVVAEFTDSAGLFVGNEVGIRGVKVGEVTGIEPRGSVVEVTLRLDEGIELPASAGAVVVSRSVATDRYIEMTPAVGDGPRMADGARIPLERTRTPVEFDDVVASLGEFSEGLLGKDREGKALRALLAEGAGHGALGRLRPIELVVRLAGLATGPPGLAAGEDRQVEVAGEDLLGGQVDEALRAVAAVRGVARLPGGQPEPPGDDQGGIAVLPAEQGDNPDRVDLGDRVEPGVLRGLTDRSGHQVHRFDHIAGTGGVIQELSGADEHWGTRIEGHGVTIRNAAEASRLDPFTFDGRGHTGPGTGDGPTLAR